MKLVLILVGCGTPVTEKKLDKDRFRKDLGDLIPAYTEVAKRLGILHEQSNVSAVTLQNCHL